MKVPPGVRFNRGTLEATGLVDIGKHTPKEQRNTMGDHVAVVIFRPFSGTWYQSLGLFLSKSNIKGPILHKLILEGTSLLERRNIYVDGIVSDAAGWNRNMWTHFGIGDKNNSCTHPIDKERKLYFFSDWCHLLKCMRNHMCPLPPKKKKRKTTVENFEENPDDPSSATLEEEVQSATDLSPPKVIMKELMVSSSKLKGS